MGREITVVGCDIGVGEEDPHSGVVVLRCDSEGVVTVLEPPATTGRRNGEELVESWLRKHGADYLVADAPLLPGSRVRPTDKCFRPHENMVRSPTHPVINRHWPGAAAEMIELLNTIQPMSCWSKSGSLSPFAQAGNELLDAVSPLGWPLIDDYDVVRPKGTLEGFPKAFYLPLISDSPDLLAIRLLPRGEKDEAFLRPLLDPKNGLFWRRTGLRLVADTNARLAFRDPDVICAFAMALNGVLYGRCQAGVLWSAMPGFRFGHILTLASSLWEAWVADWRDDRIAANASSHGYATVSMQDVPCPP